MIFVTPCPTCGDSAQEVEECSCADHVHLRCLWCGLVWEVPVDVVTHL
jgi:uncharacterized Zn finger protein